MTYTCINNNGTRFNTLQGYGKNFNIKPVNGNPIPIIFPGCTLNDCVNWHNSNIAKDFYSNKCKKEILTSKKSMTKKSFNKQNMTKHNFKVKKGFNKR
jgi:hypothetical protein